MAESDIRLVEDSVRMLAAAAGSARLYPAGSPMTIAAIDRFVEAVHRVTTALGNFRIVIDPRGLRYGDTTVADGNTTIAGLAEILYSQRAGQLLVSPGVTNKETAAFLQVIDADPVAVRQAGGVRAALSAAGVTHLSVAEIELRDDAEVDAGAEAGTDPVSAELPDVASMITEAADEWRSSAAAGRGSDRLNEMLEGMDAEEFEETQERMARAMLALDERQRLNVMQAAVAADADGKPMASTLAIVSRMPPAALARLLALFADGSGARLATALSSVRLPPEAAWALETLLSSAAENAANGAEGPFVMQEEDPAEIAAAMAAEQPDEAMARWRLVNSATPEASASRALDCTLAILDSNPDPEKVAAAGVALHAATQEGAWGTAARAATHLDLVGRRHTRLADPVKGALAPLESVETMRLACASLMEGGPADGDAANPTSAGAADVLALGGRAAAEAVATSYAATRDPAARRRLATVAVRLSNPLAGYATRIIRDMPSDDAIATIDLLAAAPCKATIGAIGKALDHLDPVVRTYAVQALCDCTEPEAQRLVIKCMDHWDPATRRVAAAELGNHHVEEAVEPLVKVLWKQEMFERNYELRKQCIESLVQIRSPRALTGLRRVASWRFVVDRRARELKFLAGQAVAELEAEAGAQHEGEART